jgi:hypothetical protein
MKRILLTAGAHAAGLVAVALMLGTANASIRDPQSANAPNACIQHPQSANAPNTAIKPLQQCNSTKVAVTCRQVCKVWSHDGRCIYVGTECDYGR